MPVSVFQQLKKSLGSKLCLYIFKSFFFFKLPIQPLIFTLIQYRVYVSHEQQKLHEYRLFLHKLCSDPTGKKSACQKDTTCVSILLPHNSIPKGWWKPKCQITDTWVKKDSVCFIPLHNGILFYWEREPAICNNVSESEDIELFKTQGLQMLSLKKWRVKWWLSSK